MQIGNKQGVSGRMKWALLLLAMLKVLNGFAQSTQTSANATIEGIVFDHDTKDRVARTIIYNITTRKFWYNNLKGEFKVDANPGDKLVFSKQDYLPDTVSIKDASNIAVYLRRTAIMLHEVTINDSLHTPLQRLAATKKEYNKAYGSSAYSDPFSSVPGGGAGLSIDALYNSLSKSGRDAEHLRGLIQQDYEQNVIDYRFNKTYISNITKLKGQDLADFMIKYRPSYYLVTTDTEYEFITYIRTSFRRYQRNKRVLSQPALRPPQS
ncbi:MAG: hypothetical protein ACHQHN_03620 [Sphingobacteriales bacterium]